MRLANLVVATPGIYIPWLNPDRVSMYIVLTCVVPDFYLSFPFCLFLSRRLLAISSMWSSRRCASFSWPSRTARTRNSRGKSPYTRSSLAWTTPCRSTSGLQTSSNSSNKRYIISLNIVYTHSTSCL